MAVEDQASDERTFKDSLLHLKKAESHLNLALHHFEWGLGKKEDIDLLEKAHNRVTKAYNTVAFLDEQITEIRKELNPDKAHMEREGF